MFAQDPNPTPRQQIGIAVAIAALSALSTGLIGWGIEELKKKYGSKPEEKKP